MHMKPTAAFVAVLGLALGAFADEIVTKAGTIYSGKIVETGDTYVVIESPALGCMKISRADISSMKAGDETSESKPAPVPGTQTPPTDPAATPPDAAPAEPTPEEKAEAQLKADEDAAALLAEQREARRKASKIVRRTDPQSGKALSAPGISPPGAPKTTTPAAAPGAATPVAGKAEEEKPTISGAQLAKTPPGSWIVVLQPPKQFESAPSGIQIGRRVYAKLESAGTGSAFLSVPMAAGEERIAMRLADVQRYATMRPGSARLSRMMEGIDRGAWVRLRLDDGTRVEGVLQVVEAVTVKVGLLKDDGTQEASDVPGEKIVEVDGLMRSSATRFTLAEAAQGEPVALTLWPDGRELVGAVRERTAAFLDVVIVGGKVERVPVDGPIADARRVPGKWRATVTSLGPKATVRAKSVEEFPDARVERDLIGTVLAVTAYAVTLDSPDGVIVLPMESMAAFDPTSTEAEALCAKAMKRSERVSRVPVMPGDPAEKASGLDVTMGVTAVTDGDVVRHVLVSAPFRDEAFGIHLGDRATDAAENTDLRFDTVVVPHHQPGAEPLPVEIVSHSVEGLSVTLLLDAGGRVSAIEIGAR